MPAPRAESSRRLPEIKAISGSTLVPVPRANQAAFLLSFAVGGHQREVECRALVRARAFDPDPPSIALDELARDVEAQARTTDGRALRHVDALKALEQTAKPFTRDAHAFVDHHHLDLTGSGVVRRDAYAAAA